MEWDSILVFARRYWPDAEETWNDPDCRAYYVRQYLRTTKAATGTHSDGPEGG